MTRRFGGSRSWASGSSGHRLRWRRGRDGVTPDRCCRSSGRRRSSPADARRRRWRRRHACLCAEPISSFWRRRCETNIRLLQDLPNARQWHVQVTDVGSTKRQIAETARRLPDAAAVHRRSSAGRRFDRRLERRPHGSVRRPTVDPDAGRRRRLAIGATVALHRRARCSCARHDPGSARSRPWPTSAICRNSWPAR